MEKTKEIKKNKAIRGGEFLVKETDFNDIFIPEEWNEEQRMIAQMCEDFMNSELFPIIDKLTRWYFKTYLRFYEKIKHSRKFSKFFID